MAFYNESISGILSKLNTTAEGLSADEVQQRLTQYGYNELQEKKKIPAWLLFLNQFKNFMIWILIVAAVLSGIMGEVIDTVIIFIIILLNAALGFMQEFRAGKAMEALKKMVITQAQVIRNNQHQVILSTQLVPGDIVILEAGNVVPADIHLIESYSLRIDESSLTGESVGVDKNTVELNEEEIPLGDQLNMAFKGTLITNGRAKGVVVLTGMQTELGKIANMLQEKETTTPLQERMAVFARNLSYIILFVCTIFFVTGFLRGEDPLAILLLSISLAVAAIPEALPALITIALSKGAARLAKKNALIRKLPAVETLGSVTFICSDKTGTLTQNKMKVVERYEHSSPEMNVSLSLVMALNHDVKLNDKEQPSGEPTELALVEDIIKNNSLKYFKDTLEKFKRMAELPFDSDRKLMTTAHPFHGKFLIVTKGASEAIANIIPDAASCNKLKDFSKQWANKGIRVLAYACKVLDKLPEPFTHEMVEKDLHFIGLTGLIDPARNEVKPAITECKTAGIKPVMITGDHPATARAIAAEIGILNDKGSVLTGAELQQLDEETFLNQVEHISVYARVSPGQKLRIVKALQHKKHFVAMTGDGVNDAPSLKVANIGVAMGISGTDVSKEAADLILLDDNFTTIVNSVKEGRRIFDNIRKFVKYIMTCNGAEIWTIFLAPLLGMPIPLLPIHILWINLVTDGLPALALSNEKAEKDIMQRAPRLPQESLFAGGIGYHIIWVGLFMAGVTLATQAWAISQNNAHWQTMVFMVLSLSQLAHVLAIRSDKISLYKQSIFTNLPLLGSVFLTFLLQMAVVYFPFLNIVFKTQPLTLKELSICIGLSVLVLHVIELEKWIKVKLAK